MLKIYYRREPTNYNQTWPSLLQYTRERLPNSSWSLEPHQWQLEGPCERYEMGYLQLHKPRSLSATGVDRLFATVISCWHWCPASRHDEANELKMGLQYAMNWRAVRQGIAPIIKIVLSYVSLYHRWTVPFQTLGTSNSYIPLPRRSHMVESSTL